MTGCLLGLGDTLISMPGFDFANCASECWRNALKEVSLCQRQAHLVLTACPWSYHPSCSNESGVLCIGGWMRLCHSSHCQSCIGWEVHVRFYLALGNCSNPLQRHVRPRDKCRVGMYEAAQMWLQSRYSTFPRGPCGVACIRASTSTSSSNDLRPLSPSKAQMNISHLSPIS